MLESFKSGKQQAEAVRDEIIDFAVGFYQEHPEHPLDLDNIALLARTLRIGYEKQGRLDIVDILDLAIEKFPQVRWLYILSEVSKHTGLDAALPDGTVRKQKSKDNSGNRKGFEKARKAEIGKKVEPKQNFKDDSFNRDARGKQILTRPYKSYESVPHWIYAIFTGLGIFGGGIPALVIVVAWLYHASGVYKAKEEYRKNAELWNAMYPGDKVNPYED